MRVATMDDAEAIMSVSNAAFRLAESFIVDRDRVDLKGVQELLRPNKSRPPQCRRDLQQAHQQAFANFAGNLFVDSDSSAAHPLNDSTHLV